MMAGRKKNTQKKRAFAGPTAMEVQDPRQSLLEVPEESLHRQPPPGSPRMESSTMNVILQLLKEVSKDTKQLRTGQNSLLSEMAEFRTSIDQMNQWLDLAESRFSSLEDRACETHQTNSIMTASQSDPLGVPPASSSSFSSHQGILDAAQTAASSNSAYVYTSREPPPPPSSGHFRAASSTLVYSETEEKAHQMLADAWSQERISESETAHREAEEPGQQEDIFSGESLLIAPEYKMEPQLLRSTEEKAIQPFDTLLSQKISESQSAHTEESDEQEDTFCGASPQESKPEPQPLMSNLPETPQPPSPAEMQKEASLTATQLSRRCPTDMRSGNSVSASTAISSGALCHLVSSLPTEVMSPTQHPRASIAWRYFTKHPTSKFIATCNICGMDVKTGKIGGCGKVGTSALLKHMKRIHHIARERKTPSVLPAEISKISNTGRSSTIERSHRTGSGASSCTTTSAAILHSLSSSLPAEVKSPSKHPRASIAWRYFTKHPTSKFIATCNICRKDVKIGKIGGCGKVGTSALLKHMKRIHHIARERKTPSVLPAEISKICNKGRSSTIDRPRRTGSELDLCSLTPSAPAEVKSPNKLSRASIAWHYFKKHPASKFTATCNICGAHVKTGKVGGCGKAGTAPLLSHIKRIHHIVLKK